MKANTMTKKTNAHQNTLAFLKAPLFGKVFGQGRHAL
jgi:hypothetical protein